MPKEKSHIIPFILITSLFFLWGFAHNLNPVLIPHLKKACQLTDSQSALIDSAFFIGYFVMALPAGGVMQRYGYKFGMITGLFLFALGAFLFYPAAETRQYSFFLLALFVISSGLTFLETAANPYIVALGKPETATQRLNLSQSFNGLAATLAPLIGGFFILSNSNIAGNNYSKEALDVILRNEAKSVQLPYLVIGAVVFIVAIAVWRTSLPEITQEVYNDSTPSKRSLFRSLHFALGVTAQFFYVGAQVCISSFFIRFAGFVSNIAQTSAAFYLSAALFAFMTGRFAGTVLLKFIRPEKLLMAYSIFNIVLLAIAVTSHGQLPLYSLIGVEFFMSIMFPTIFSLTLQRAGHHSKLGSSLLIMSIAGGAVMPVIMGRVSDILDIQTSYIVPCMCFLVVLFFAIKCFSNQESRKHAFAKIDAL